MSSTFQNSRRCFKLVVCFISKFIYNLIIVCGIINEKSHKICTISVISTIHRNFLFNWLCKNYSNSSYKVNQPVACSVLAWTKLQGASREQKTAVLNFLVFSPRESPPSVTSHTLAVCFGSVKLGTSLEKRTHKHTHNITQEHQTWMSSLINCKLE